MHCWLSSIWINFDWVGKEFIDLKKKHLNAWIRLLSQSDWKIPCAHTHIYIQTCICICKYSISFTDELVSEGDQVFTESTSFLMKEQTLPFLTWICKASSVIFFQFKKICPLCSQWAIEFENKSSNWHLKLRKKKQVKYANQTDVKNLTWCWFDVNWTLNILTYIH